MNEVIQIIIALIIITLGYISYKWSNKLTIISVEYITYRGLTKEALEKYRKRE